MSGNLSDLIKFTMFISPVIILMTLATINERDKIVITNKEIDEIGKIIKQITDDLFYCSSH